jgi:SAM-dependent methyltransferase
LTDDEFWDFYWEMRLTPLENLGKQAAILAISRLMRTLAEQVNHPLRLLELGCGEGQVIGQLLDAHAQICDISASVGVDYNAASLAVCRRAYPGVKWVEGDFTSPELLNGLGKFDIVVLVNALHEVFSDTLVTDLSEIDIQAGKLRVEEALAAAGSCLESGGWLVLLDGLEPPGDPNRLVRIRFRDKHVRDDFDIFLRQYRPVKISCREVSSPLFVELSQRDFTRYITKSIFLGKRLWETERLQSYQYFTEQEYRASFARLGLEISEVTKLTMNDEKWRRLVEIETSGVSFPDEHILILAAQQPR